jgi:hypothetical protein
MSLQPEPTLHPVQRVQPPWPLKAESYLLFLKMKELPKGLYDSLEKVWEGSEFGRFEGGLGAIMIVRYWDTPVGTFEILPYLADSIARRSHECDVSLVNSLADFDGDHRKSGISS